MDIFKYFLYSIELLIFIYLMLATVYVFIFGFAGIFYSDKKKNKVDKLRKFAVLIPGYKEDAVIVNVARQALTQDYPDDKYEVIVIADSFEQKTLDALNKLPIRVVVVEFEVSKKSKALNKCMSIIGDDYDVAFILDADNVMEKDVLSRINAAFDNGYVAVQGHRTAKNLNANFAILDAMSEEINNNIFRRGHRVLGFSSALIGSGMGVDYSLFKSTMATVDSVGEDKELELKLLKQGYKIEYVHKAIIYDEKTSKSDVFVTQRRRWIAAQLDYFRKYLFDGIINVFSKGNFDYFDKVIQMIQPPRIMLTGVLVIIVSLLSLLFIPSLAFLQEFVLPGYWFWFSLFVMTTLALLFSIPLRFYNGRTFVALLRVPMGFILMVVSLFKVKGATKKFLHTTHSHVDNEN
jgi:cellulose synthase/poly-beta-1,6-N-acetylglucosamine synthase-like glycosyltransferase